MKIVLSLLYAPIVFFALFYFHMEIDDALYLKIVPLVIASFVTFSMLHSYIKKKSMILYFAKKFAKHKISQKEEIYIHNSTLFWIIVSVLNILIHLILFLANKDLLWVMYSSFGWYLLFGVAGIAQYLHRRFIFLRVINA